VRSLILLDTGPGAPRPLVPKIADFGLAKQTGRLLLAHPTPGGRDRHSQLHGSRAGRGQGQRDNTAVPDVYALCGQSSTSASIRAGRLARAPTPVLTLSTGPHPGSRGAFCKLQPEVPRDCGDDLPGTVCRRMPVPPLPVAADLADDTFAASDPAKRLRPDRRPPVGSAPGNGRDDDPAIAGLVRSAWCW